MYVKPPFIILTYEPFLVFFWRMSKRLKDSSWECGAKVLLKDTCFGHAVVYRDDSVGQSTTLVQFRISQQLLHGLPWNSVQIFIVPWGCIVMTLVISWLFSSGATMKFGSCFWFMSRQLWDGLPWNLFQTTTSGWIESLNFSLPSSGQHLNVSLFSLTKYLQNNIPITLCTLSVVLAWH